MVYTVYRLVYALGVRRDGLARGGRTERRTGSQGQCREGRERGGGHNPDRRVTRSLEGVSFPGSFAAYAPASLPWVWRGLGAVGSSWRGCRRRPRSRKNAVHSASNSGVSGAWPVTIRVIWAKIRGYVASANAISRTWAGSNSAETR